MYFSHEGRLYRVARPLHCAAGGSCAFFSLSVAEVAEPAVGECSPGTPNCVMSIFPDGRREHTRRDPPLTAQSGRLWPPAMGVKLRDVPASGLTISREEYDRHKEIYFPLLEWRRIGANYIDDGFLYQYVRLCQIDVGADAACNITPPGHPVGK